MCDSQVYSGTEIYTTFSLEVSKTEKVAADMCKWKQISL